MGCTTVLLVFARSAPLRGYFRVFYAALVVWSFPGAAGVPAGPLPGGPCGAPPDRSHGVNAQQPLHPENQVRLERL